MELVRAAEWPGELAACCRVLTRSEINKRNQLARVAAWYQVGVDAMHEAFPMVIAVIGVIAVSSIILRFASALAKRLEGRPPVVTPPDPAVAELRERSEERRVGKECRSRWSP